MPRPTTLRAEQKKGVPLYAGAFLRTVGMDTIRRTEARPAVPACQAPDMFFRPGAGPLKYHDPLRSKQQQGKQPSGNPARRQGPKWKGVRQSARKGGSFSSGFIRFIPNVRLPYWY